MDAWKAYHSGKGNWELYNLSADVEEKVNLASHQPTVLERLIQYSKEAHKPIRPGEIYRNDLIEKDRLQSPAQQARAARKTTLGLRCDRRGFVVTRAVMITDDTAVDSELQ